MSPAHNGILFRNKECEEGVTNVVNQNNSVLQHLRYSRLYLDKQREAAISCGSNEALLVVLNGEAAVESGGQSFTLRKHDVAYFSRDEAFKVIKLGPSALSALLFEAPADRKHPSKVVKFDEVKKRTAGQGACEREVYLMVSEENIEADRLILGYCWGGPGGWTGWPPHEHTASLEELYVFHDIPQPGFVVQMLYDDLNEVKCIPAREGDAIAISGGYHPVVAVPGYRMKNVWVMAAKRPGADRHLNLAKVQPEFVS